MVGSSGAAVSYERGSSVEPATSQPANAQTQRWQQRARQQLQHLFCKTQETVPYPSSGQAFKFERQEVLDRSQGPTVGRMRLLAT